MELDAGSEGQAMTIITASEWLDRLGSVRRVTLGEMKAANADGNVLAAGAIGEIYILHLEASPATYSYRGAAARSLPSGWESLGDIGYFDADGYLYLVDRRTDMIPVGGQTCIWPKSRGDRGALTHIIPRRGRLASRIWAPPFTPTSKLARR